jgi:uncharacterized protein YbbK (DUF523 family)
MKTSKSNSKNEKPSEKRPIIVSACLLGINCVYDGSSNKNKKILQLMEKHLLIPVCPEQLGGLSTPRDPQNITLGSGEDVLQGKARVITVKGEDVTENFKKGASEVLEIARMHKVKLAILKENSPSCGVKFIYNLIQNQKFKTEGLGVTTALLTKSGLKVISEETVEENQLSKLV